MKSSGALAMYRSIRRSVDDVGQSALARYARLLFIFLLFCFSASLCRANVFEIADSERIDRLGEMADQIERGLLDVNKGVVGRSDADLISQVLASAARFPRCWRLTPVRLLLVRVQARESATGEATVLIGCDASIQRYSSAATSVQRYSSAATASVNCTHQLRPTVPTVVISCDRRRPVLIRWLIESAVWPRQAIQL
jgi:hypothetical protein